MRSWPRPARSVLALTFALLLAACTMFAPRYNAQLDQNATAAYQQVAQLAAKGDLGSFVDPASYAAAADQYASALAALSVAKLRATTLEVQGKPATRARTLLVEMLQGCSDQLTSFANLHKTVGIRPGSGATQPLMVSCDTAVRAAQAMKP